MTNVLFPTIDLRATGENIIRLRKANGFTVRELQHYFGFEEPQAIYKWQQGKCLPSVDNLYALSRLFGVSMNEILVQSQLNLISNGQSDDCPFHFFHNTLQESTLIINILTRRFADVCQYTALSKGALSAAARCRHTKSQSFQSISRLLRTE